MKKIFFLLILASSMCTHAQNSIDHILTELPAYLLGFDSISRLQKGDLVPVLAITIHTALPQAHEKVIAIQELLATQKTNPAIVALEKAMRDIKTEIHILYQKEFLMSYRADDAARGVATLKAALILAKQEIEEYLKTNPQEKETIEKLIQRIDTIALQ